MNATGVQAAQTLAAELKRRWRRGEQPNAVAALADHPDLARYKSIVLDLAFEEYLLREKDGAAPDLGLFAAQFPAFGASVRKMLEANQMLGDEPDVLDPAAAPWPEVGATFEGLDLVAELGRGAFGRAYLAFDPGTDRLCALKLAPGAAAEARVIGKLAHANVTDIYWARAVGPRTAVCMPFVGVSTLADVIATAFPAGKPPPTSARVILDAAEADALAGQADRRSTPVVLPDEPYAVGACAVGARIAAAVAYLHGEGVTHGDLKPSNVVVGPGGAPHLIDFNLAAGETPPASVRGTPAYMAPEVLDAALAGRATAAPNWLKADVFALGVVLFELLTGRHPHYSGEKVSLADLAAAARRGPPPLPASVPQPVAAVIAACLAPDPAARPASAGVVAAALDHYVQKRRTAGRRWRLWAIAIAGLALTATATGVGVNTWSPPPPPEIIVQPPPPPKTAEEFLARGREFLRAGDVSAAQADFVTAHRMSGDPWAIGFAAYCVALNGQPAVSAAMNRQAVQGGAASAEVFNNLGYALIQSNQLAEGILALDDALRIFPGMQAALYNRALARYRIGLATPKKAVDSRAANDVTGALAAGPPSVDLHYDAARIYAVCSAGDPTLRERAFGQIRAAIAAGKDPAMCRKEPVFQSYLAKDPGFAAACNTPRGVAPEKSPQLRLVEPRGP